jgi:hypothetical protein
MSTHSHDDDSSSDLSPVVSRAVLTPRGGFMARPGLKNPPRHAVVVRGGNAELSGEIPVARSSCPPPPPAVEQRPSDPAPVASCDKVTIPALPRLPTIDLSERVTAKLDPVLPPPDSAPAAWAPRSIGSVPPPSDAPFATNVRESTLSAGAVKRRSGWTIVAAAAIGLLLGLASIASTLGRAHSAAQQQPEAQPLGVAPPNAPAARPLPVPQAPATRRDSAPAPSALSAAATPAQPPAPSPAPARKKSIF